MIHRCRRFQVLTIPQLEQINALYQIMKVYSLLLLSLVALFVAADQEVADTRKEAALHPKAHVLMFFRTSMRFTVSWKILMTPTPRPVEKARARATAAARAKERATTLAIAMVRGVGSNPSVF